MGDRTALPPGTAECAAVFGADIWREVARRLATHRSAGRGHLLTEDVVRMETVLALEQAGVSASRLVAEHLAPELAGGKLDLVVDPPDGVVIELKYPRDSSTGFSPDTMTLGELVRDFLRVAVVPARERWVVQVLNPRLARYLSGLQHRHQLHWATTRGAQLRLDPEVVAALPATAVAAIGRATVLEAVTARCVVVAPVDADLVLYAYDVDPVAATVTPNAFAPAALAADAPVAETALVPPEPRGARAAILAAARAITTRSGREHFTISEVVSEFRGSRYAESTIRTMMSSHLCAQAQGPGIDHYTDLDRVERGVYRLRAAHHAPQDQAREDGA